MTCTGKTLSARASAALLIASALFLGGCSTDSGDNKTSSSDASQTQPTGKASEGSSKDSTAEGDSSPKKAKKNELIGGGKTVFPDRRMVALYGAPGNPSLGVLGEQGPAASVKRVKDLAKQYEPYSEEPVVPAFEVIASVADAAPGEDGDYSNEMTPEQLRPLLDEAKKSGVYVILDLQPGLQDFTSQIKEYEDILKDPNVGVGLDAEWRLAPGQKPLEQIGSVGASEVNDSLRYIADLTKRENLPQKAVVIHQFAGFMITNREQIDTSHPELALTLHADGHGTPGLKKETWEALQKGLPQGIRMSWKNFYDEDTPMFTPEQTYQMEPKPWVVTYQ
ncbi:hypothetical protein GMA10_09340 [Kocuria koreensis]|jgi:hypothetical protein|uniref:Lipoprotein n=1 Tax=Rothia koreensis TaxID=592378 RepID=A0A7K1LJN1_9MICC|nr:hypothetical protein [Rothia koreensis]MUN55407.1 hypothetical protein [Rothia koreensis]